jgi:hypothetical protein
MAVPRSVELPESVACGRTFLYGSAVVNQRCSFATTAAVVASLWVMPALAKDVVVPVALQAELFAKVIAHDRNVATRAGGRLRIHVVAKAKDPDSVRIAAQLHALIAQRGIIAGLPVEVAVTEWEVPAVMAATCKSAGVSVLYLSTGFTSAEVTEMAGALAGTDIFTVAADPLMVTSGALLGFDLVSGRPKLVFHLAQARRQNVAVQAGVLQLMKVVE